MSLDDQALKDHYREHTVDLSWLNKPSQHVFRWRTNDNRWLTAKRFPGPRILPEGDWEKRTSRRLRLNGLLAQPD